jgi:hypothetical protein
MILASFSQVFWLQGIPINWYLIIFSCSYPVAVVLYLLYWVQSAKHDPIYQQRQMTFDDEKMTIKTDDGSYSEIMYSNIQKIRVFGEKRLLYLSKSQWIYVTKSAFKSNLDYDKFIELINTQPNKI